MLTRRIVVGITGASGVIYGIEFLRLLKNSGLETHLIITPAGARNIALETGIPLRDVEALANYVYNSDDLEAPPASGSFITYGMVVIPCSIKTLSGVANCYTENLLLRAADVTLKERRKLVLAVRETPLHKGHLRLMEAAADAGALIFPPVPAFYHRPLTIADLISQTLGKICDYLEIPHHLFQRWGETGGEGGTEG